MYVVRIHSCTYACMSKRCATWNSYAYMLKHMCRICCTSYHLNISEVSHRKNLSWWTVLGQQKGSKRAHFSRRCGNKSTVGPTVVRKEKSRAVAASMHMYEDKTVGRPKCNNNHFKEYWPGNNLFLLRRAPTGVDDKKIGQTVELR